MFLNKYLIDLIFYNIMQDRFFLAINYPLTNVQIGYFLPWYIGYIKEHCPGELARGFGSVVKHSTADPGIASSIPPHSN